MADSAMDVYLNDHLGGAMFGSDLAEQLQRRSDGTPLGEVMKWLAPQIEEDRQTLIGLMEDMGSSKSSVKQAATWLAEKASRVKLGGLPGTENEPGTFMALETLSLGVEGKVSLWTVLREVADRYHALDPAELDRLIERGRAQRQALETERVMAARELLQGDT